MCRELRPRCSAISGVLVARTGTGSDRCGAGAASGLPWPRPSFPVLSAPGARPGGPRAAASGEIALEVPLASARRCGWQAWCSPRHQGSGAHRAGREGAAGAGWAGRDGFPGGGGSEMPHRLPAKFLLRCVLLLRGWDAPRGPLSFTQPLYPDSPAPRSKRASERQCWD